MLVRTISSLVLLPFLLAVLWLCPPVCTVILFAAASAVAAFEVTWNTNLAKNPRLVSYAVIMAILTAVWCHFGMEYKWALIAVFVFVAVLCCEMIFSNLKIQFINAVTCGVAGIVIPFFLCSIIRLREGTHGVYLVILPFLICFLSDTGAYFAGRFFGKHKLAPVISPKKTVEGAIGGAVTAVAGMMIYGIIMEKCFGFQFHYWIGLVYGLLGSCAGIMGDLTFSAIKRQTGIKDYGKLIPGHGGIMDRFDSTIAIAPLIELLVFWLPVAVK